MKKSAIFSQIFPAALAGIALLGGCASQQDMRKVNLEMHTLDNRLIAIEESIKDIQQRIGTSVDSVQKKQAGIGNTIDQLNTRLLQTKGQLEESRHRYRSLNAELIRISKNLDQRLDRIDDKTGVIQEKLAAETSSLQDQVSTINTRLTGLQKEIGSLQQDTATLNQQIKNIKEARIREKAARARKAAETASAAREQVETADTEPTGTLHRITPVEKKKVVQASRGEPLEQEAEEQRPEEKAAPAEPVEQKSAAEKQYETAMNKFRAGDYREAKEIFSDIRKEYDGQEIAVKARFMVADCLFQLGNHSLAILEYQQVISDHPRHNKVPHALYNQATAFEKLGDEKTANIVYRKVVREFPDSEEAGLAKKKL